MTSAGDRLAIRPYEPTDADAVWRVHEAAIRASPIPFHPDAPDTDLRDVRAAYADGAFLVGLVDAAVVATGAYRPVDESTVELRRMRVHPDHQGRGYGRRMLAELERRAAAAGAGTVVLETHERLAAARGLYEDEGYRETGRESLPVGDDELVAYAKEL